MTAPQAPSIAQLLSGGGKYFPFKEIGDSITGIVETVHDPEQQTDFETNAPLTKPDGSPKWQFRIDLQTDIRNDEDDNGKRTLYVKGWMTGAIGDALRTAGAGGLEPGARLTVAVISQDPPPRKGMRPVNKFSAVYEAPAPGASAAANALLRAQAATAVAAPPAAPAAQAPAPAAPAGPPPGIDPAQWATWSPEQQQQVLAAMPGF